MKKRNNYLRLVYWVFACIFILTACSDNHRSVDNLFSKDNLFTKEKSFIEKENPEEKNTEKPERESDSVSTELETVYADWSEYFNGLNGAAVVYDASNRRYTIYNRKHALTRRTPCSTFKIISSLIALEHGMITPEDSIRKWSGEIFWNEDWKGRLNTNNNNRALTGFWIESSLKISPKEQVEVMERIFGEHSGYSEKAQSELKKVMLVSGKKKKDISIYGKTGMGRANGVVVDAWYTGLAESAEGNLYFCVYLGRTDGRNISSTLAKKIALQIVSRW